MTNAAVRLRLARVEAVRRPHRARRRHARRSNGQGVLPARSQRHRQERHAPSHHRPGAAGSGQGVRRGPRRHRAVAARAGRRPQAHGLPVSERGAVRFDERRRERRVPDAAPYRLAEDGDLRAGPQQKLAAVGLEQDIDKMPSDLSGGMQKRVGPGAGDGARPVDPARRRTECRARSDHHAEIDELLVATRSGPARRWSSSPTTSRAPAVVGDDFALLHEGRIAARARPRSWTPATTRSSATSCARKEAGRWRLPRVSPASALFVLGTVLLFAVGALHDRRPPDGVHEDGSSSTPSSRRSPACRPGAIVRVSGRAPARSRRSPRRLEPAGKFRVELQITEELHPLVRTDSIASIETEGLVGGSYLAISLGVCERGRGSAAVDAPGPGAVRDRRSPAADEHDRSPR